MQFSDPVFLVFFLVVVLLHNVRLSWTLRKFNLLWLSYVFYAAWNPPFVVLLWISTVVDWYVGKWLHEATGRARRAWLLVVSLAVNLGMLGYFKYGGFILENFVVLVQGLGIDWQPAAPSIVLPVGISFYTFQTLSYTLDIYHRRLEPCRSFLDYALYVTFFPQLVAGPVVRARHFLPQCLKPKRVSADAFGWGMCLFVIGSFQKIVVADGLLALTVENVFDGRALPTTVDAWLGCVGFAVQVFCDFSGYSLCAIGVAKCLGFELPINFRFPFAATSFSGLWRRWHISVTSWIRDYVYGSIRGESRGRSPRWAFNTIFSASLVGLWHGASWHWVLWGVAVGCLLVVEGGFRAVFRPRTIWETIPAQFCFAALTFAQFCATMLFARTPSMGRLAEVASAMFLGSSDGRAPLLSTDAVVTTTCVAMLFFVGHWFMRHSSLEEVAEKLPWGVKSAAIVVMVGMILLSRAPDRAFIYFQF